MHCKVKFCPGKVKPSHCDFVFYYLQLFFRFVSRENANNLCFLGKFKHAQGIRLQLEDFPWRREIRAIEKYFVKVSRSIITPHFSYHTERKSKIQVQVHWHRQSLPDQFKLKMCLYFPQQNKETFIVRLINLVFFLLFLCNSDILKTTQLLQSKVLPLQSVAVFSYLQLYPIHI